MLAAGGGLDGLTTMFVVLRMALKALSVCTGCWYCSCRLPACRDIRTGKCETEKWQCLFTGPTETRRETVKAMVV